MMKAPWLSILSGVVGFAVSTAALAQGGLDAAKIQAIKGAVVTVTVQPAGTTIGRQAVGTIIDPTGLAVVPADIFVNPVVGRAGGGGVESVYVAPNRVRVTVRLLDGSVVAAQFVAADARSGLATVRLSVNAALSALSTGSEAKPKVGEPVAVILPDGDALDAALSRYAAGVDASTQQFIPLIEVALLRGAASGLAGSPVVNAQGKLIGILRAHRTLASSVTIAERPEAAWFAVPADLVQLVVGGLSGPPYVVRYPWLGLQVANAPGGGAVVKSVSRLGPAATLLAPGDVIVEGAGMAIKTSGDFAAMVFRQKVGATVTLVIKRAGVATAVRLKVSTVQEGSYL
jgi:S1-C subfamily serine protease